MGKCRLCGNEAKLQDSHMLPKFVFKWLKETSATGYIRTATNPNYRQQDSIRIKLLCEDCEQRFSVVEKSFAEQVFRPYVDNELDDWGVARGAIESFKYEEWLLRFVLSVNWRVLSYHIDKGINDLPASTVNELRQQEHSIRQYLLEESESTGSNSSYLLFLQNLASGSGSLPPRMDPSVNFYLLRSVDGTLVISRRGKAGLAYSKVGPIALITSLLPPKLSKMSTTSVHKKGHISTNQEFRNTDITEFIFIDRPKEASENVKYSDKQKKKISETIEKDPQRAMNSLSAKTQASGELMKMLIEEENRR